MNNSSAVPVGILGASGYTGRELLAILRRHDGVRVAFATARAEAGTETPIPGLAYVEIAEADLREAEIVFLCLPHGEAAPWAERLQAEGKRVVDLTGDHRPGSGRENGAVYGLPELAGERIRHAALVANPGCYPTGVILALDPLLRDGLVDARRPVIVNAASGITGAGRSPRRDLMFAEVAGDFRPYALGNVHRHLREMTAALPGLQLLFTPHLLPLPRGILETVYLPVADGMDAGVVRQAWERAYRGSPVVSVSTNGDAPTLGRVVGTDRLVLGAVDNEGVDPSVVTVVVALDNLGKGASGQAVQNMNLMLGLPAERGLRC